MTEYELKEWANSLSLDEIEAEGLKRMAVFQYMDGLGIPTDAYNAGVDLLHLLGAAITKAKGTEQ